MSAQNCKRRSRTCARKFTVSDWRIEQAARLIWIKPTEAEKILSNALK